MQSRMVWLYSLLGLFLMGGLLSGCDKPLFPERLPRTQYERADRLRGEFAPQQRRGRYGDPEPALRDRLTPYE